jgi:hypothetical protein
VTTAVANDQNLWKSSSENIFFIIRYIFIIQVDNSFTGIAIPFNHLDVFSTSFIPFLWTIARGVG